jgi:hypothetical protein
VDQQMLNVEKDHGTDGGFVGASRLHREVCPLRGEGHRGRNHGEREQEGDKVAEHFPTGYRGNQKQTPVLEISDVLCKVPNESWTENIF